jgi:hypothetical protein
MPFFNSPAEPHCYVDTSKFTPVAVIVNFSVEGKMMPIYLRYIHADQSEETIKIDGIKYTKDMLGGFSMCCIISLYGYNREVILNYYVKDCRWYMAK